jgi:glutathione synthase/RimK-type ligase-like ATP-grasp enzyme
LGYRSSDSWRSNYGDDVNIDLISVTKNDRHEWRLSEELKKYPLLAIDSVISHNGDSYFVDLNTSPSWRHTWLEELLHPAVVYKFMEEYVNETLS